MNKKCGGGPLVTDDNSGEILCSSCGRVVAERTPVSSPVQSFTGEEYIARSRTGSKTTLAINDMGLSTVISSGSRDASGNTIEAGARRTFERLRKWDNRSKCGNSEAALRSAFTILNTVRTKIGISDAVIEDAAYLYRKAKVRKIRGRTIDCMTLATLYIACRKSSTPRTIPDIATAGNVSVKELSRHVRLLIEDLDIKLDSYDSSFFVSRIASTVGTRERSMRDALAILAKLKEERYSEGKNPVALAASAVYLACALNGENYTQRQISDAAGISIVTLRMRSESISKSFKIEKLVENK